MMTIIINYYWPVLNQSREAIVPVCISITPNIGQNLNIEIKKTVNEKAYIFKNLSNIT